MIMKLKDNARLAATHHQLWPGKADDMGDQVSDDALKSR